MSTKYFKCFFIEFSAFLQPDVSTIDELGSFYDIAGISYCIEVTTIPEPSS